VGTAYTTDLIGLRESSLHRDLKSYYAYIHKGHIEERVCGYRIDVLSGKNAYEIQTRALHKIRPKIIKLTDEGYSVCVVYPLQGILDVELPLRPRRRIKRDTSALRAFDELVYVAKLLPKDRFSVDILLLHERRREKSSRRNRVRNTRLVGILAKWTIRTPQDLSSLLPRGLPSTFTTKDLVEKGRIRRDLAAKIAYTLWHSGAAVRAGRKGRYFVYRLTPAGCQPRSTG